MTPDERLKRLRFRAWHRGTKEADLIIGGFFDHAHAGWGPADIDWFEALLNEEDVEIMAWALGTRPCPAHHDGANMAAMRRLDYVPVAR